MMIENKYKTTEEFQNHMRRMRDAQNQTTVSDKVIYEQNQKLIKTMETLCNKIDKLVTTLNSGRK